MNAALFRPQFGRVISLSGKQQFLDAVDKEDPNIVVVVHLYSEVLKVTLVDNYKFVG